MNIFMSDNNPILCAKYLDDLRLNKMILESGIILSTAIATTDCIIEKSRKTYLPFQQRNNRCIVWARETKGNYRWLLKHLIALIKEKKRRTGKIHKTIEIIFGEKGLFWYRNKFLNSEVTKFNGEFSKTNFTNYKDYLNWKWNGGITNPRRKTKKEILPKWTNCEKPYFYKKEN